VTELPIVTDLETADEFGSAWIPNRAGNVRGSAGKCAADVGTQKTHCRRRLCTAAGAKV
jgi:hypothetical protein